MSKLLEKNGAEMCAALVSIAVPIKNFLEDDEFAKLFKEKTKEGVTNRAENMLDVYSSLAPVLFGDVHLKDTLAILAVIEGTTVSKLLKMNGTEMLKDALEAWQTQIAPFFSRLGLSA